MVQANYSVVMIVLIIHAGLTFLGEKNDHFNTHQNEYSKYIHPHWHFALSAYVATAMKPVHRLQIRPILYN